RRAPPRAPAAPGPAPSKAGTSASLGGSFGCPLGQRSTDDLVDRLLDGDVNDALAAIHPTVAVEARGALGFPVGQAVVAGEQHLIDDADLGLPQHRRPADAAGRVRPGRLAVQDRDGPEGPEREHDQRDDADRDDLPEVDLVVGPVFGAHAVMRVIQLAHGWWYLMEAARYGSFTGTAGFPRRRQIVKATETRPTPKNAVTSVQWNVKRSVSRLGMTSQYTSTQ